MSNVKAIKGGKTEAEPEVQTITLRGVAYRIREVDVIEYKECLKAATDPVTKMTPFGDLLEQLVMRCVSPSPAAGSKPMPYPIYRRLEGIVNEMHFIDIESEEEKAEAAKLTAEPGAEEEQPEEEADPNS